LFELGKRFAYWQVGKFIKKSFGFYDMVSTNQKVSS
jgi:hypothetical protein